MGVLICKKINNRGLIGRERNIWYACRYIVKKKKTYQVVQQTVGQAVKECLSEGLLHSEQLPSPSVSLGLYGQLHMEPWYPLPNTNTNRNNICHTTV